jgi:sodium-dependent lysophosphatidylcholine symporter 1
MHHTPKQTFWQGLRTTVTTRSYLMLTLLYVWVWMGVQVGQSNYILWFKYSIDREDDYQQVLIVLLATTLLAVPCWFLLLRRLGKRLSYAVGIVMSVPSTLFMCLAPRHCPLWLLHLNSVWSGVSLSSVYLLPWTMLPDVIDADELLTGVRKESLFYSFFVFFQKFAAGIAVGLSTFALELGGYKSEPCCGESQPSSVDSTLRLMMGIMPLPLNALSLLFTYWYPITAESQRLTKARLNDLRAERKRQDATLSLHDRHQDSGGTLHSNESTA